MWAPTLAGTASPRPSLKPKRPCISQASPLLLTARRNVENGNCYDRTWESLTVGDDRSICTELNTCSSAAFPHDSQNSRLEM